MKRAVTVLLLAFLLTGCGVSTELPDDPVVFEQKVNEQEGYAYLGIDDKIYVPYCPFERRYIGDCIGYCDHAQDAYTSGGRSYIYEFKGYSSDEWIVEYDPEINEGMVMREINTANIPDGLSSEYDWNN